MNHQRVATVKVGFLTIIALLVLITTVIWLRGRTFGGGQTFDVMFRDVYGLRDGAPVQFMGIRVGFVERVVAVRTADKKYRVQVKFTVTEPDVQVPKGSVISLQQSGIIGEMFMEVTPPSAKHYDLVLSHKEPSLRRGLPIMVAFQDGLKAVGIVDGVDVKEEVKVFRKQPDYRYELKYRINTPGYLPPSDPNFKFVTDDDGTSYLVLLDKNAFWEKAPPETLYFTVEEPLRLKEFLEEQLASAEALKLTNDKINQVLSDEAISSIQGTLKNSEKLTAQATETLAQANKMFASTSKDLNTLVTSTQALSASIVEVSNNVNEIAGNPELKANIQKTVRSLEQSSSSLATLLNDPALKLILSDAQATSHNASELVQYLKSTAIDNNLQGRVNQSLTHLETSLEKLSSIMSSLEVIGDDKETLQGIIRDTKETSENLNQFSERLNKRFLLFRLLF